MLEYDRIDVLRYKCSSMIELVSLKEQILKKLVAHVVVLFFITINFLEKNLDFNQMYVMIVMIWHQNPWYLMSNYKRYFQKTVKKKNKKRSKPYYEDNKERLQKMKEDWYKNLSEKKNIKKRVCKKLVLEMFEEIKQKLKERINIKICLKKADKEI